MSQDSQIIFKELLDRHRHIQIPMIQRDFAQGRSSESTVRELFLFALYDALCKPVVDPTLPLKSDFIYGSVEGREETRFLPLDGQQRLTTLFLLHWYLAWKDEKWDDFEAIFLDDKKARFSYAVRQSSNEFFDQLVCYRPIIHPNDVLGNSRLITALITDQPWYFLSWRLDPTIQSVLLMLDAIHTRFAFSSGLFTRLIDEIHPAITFQLLDLKDFGLSDDLYIKMNARGKPLTPFETFKARYEEKLKNQLNDELFYIDENSFSAADYVALRMDTTWADLFWNLRDPNSHQFDQAFMNLARAIILVTRDPDDESYVGYLDDVATLRRTREVPAYADFHDRGWLDERFTLTLIHLLDAWSTKSGTLSCSLPNNSYFDERNIFDKIASGRDSLSYAEMVQLAAYVTFIDKYHDLLDSSAFQEWMRIAYNLSTNTIYNRAEDFRRSISGLNGMLEHADNILNHFAQSEKVVTGFFESQIAEEMLKAKLILAENRWRKLIDQAENHGYFRGQIGFLLDFCDAVTVANDLDPSLWEITKHTTILGSFERYLSLAQNTFSASGLVDLGEYRWQRALLSFGNYLLPRSSNLSFLVNTATDETSWKRLLRGIFTNPEPRELLKQLWNQLNLDEDLATQLDRIINAIHDIDPWRKALILCPEAFEYCERAYIRKNSDDEIYLLKRTQMNGYHAELFTYFLSKRIKYICKDFSSSYQDSMETYSEPRIHLTRKIQGQFISLTVINDRGGYLITIAKNDYLDFTKLEGILKTVGYLEKDDRFQYWSSRSDIEAHLKALGTLDSI